MSFADKINAKADIAYKYLSEYLKCSDADLKTIYDSMMYSVSAGGKRIRPILMMSVYEMFSDDYEKVMPFACALEMIHTYSLIHDDLPEMDNSSLRRGKPTNHMVYGDAMAVLAGDGLLNTAFETMASKSTVKPDLAIKAIAEMAKYSGITGMIGGQVIDIEHEGKIISGDLLIKLHMKKTAALISSATVVGAILGGADEEQINALRKYAENLGIAFQIKDDILDVEGNSAELGKPVGNDEACDKNTYVSIFGLEKSKEMLAQYSHNADKCLDIFGEKADFLKEITDYLLNRTN